MISARDALERLRAGNRRFVSDDRAGAALTSRTRRQALAAGQEPFAIVLGCSDSRVPAEIVFDQGVHGEFQFCQCLCSAIIRRSGQSVYREPRWYGHGIIHRCREFPQF
jgi:carbonic anhydrase